MIPDFQPNGMLPPGDYEVSLEELRTSVLVLGPDHRSSTWDSAWRGLLVDNLEVLCKQLWKAGIFDIFVDGSFAEERTILITSTGTLSAISETWHLGGWPPGLICSTLTRFGHGIPQPANHIVAIQNLNYPCGISTVSSSTPIHQD